MNKSSLPYFFINDIRVKVYVCSYRIYALIVYDVSLYTGGTFKYGGIFSIIR